MSSKDTTAIYNDMEELVRRTEREAFNGGLTYAKLRIEAGGGFKAVLDDLEAARPRRYTHTIKLNVEVITDSTAKEVTGKEFYAALVRLMSSYKDNPEELMDVYCDDAHTTWDADKDEEVSPF